MREVAKAGSVSAQYRSGRANGLKDMKVRHSRIALQIGTMTWCSGDVDLRGGHGNKWLRESGRRARVKY